MAEMNRRHLLAGCLAAPIVGIAALKAGQTRQSDRSQDDKERKHLVRFARYGGYLLWIPKQEITSTYDAIFYSLAEIELHNLKCISFSLDAVSHFGEYKTVGRWIRQGYYDVNCCRVVIAPLLKGFSWSFETQQWMEGKDFHGRVNWEGYREYKIENLPPRKPTPWADNFEKQMYGLRTNG